MAGGGAPAAAGRGGGARGRGAARRGTRRYEGEPRQRNVSRRTRSRARRKRTGRARAPGLLPPPPLRRPMLFEFRGSFRARARRSMRHAGRRVPAESRRFGEYPPSHSIDDLRIRRSFYGSRFELLQLALAVLPTKESKLVDCITGYSAASASRSALVPLTVRTSLGFSLSRAPPHDVSDARDARGFDLAARPSSPRRRRLWSSTRVPDLRLRHLRLRNRRNLSSSPSPSRASHRRDHPVRRLFLLLVLFPFRPRLSPRRVRFARDPRDCPTPSRCRAVPPLVSSLHPSTVDRRPPYRRIWGVP